MRTEQGVSVVVSVATVLVSLVAFTLLYGALMVADIYLLAKYARRTEGESGEALSPAGAH
jgi:cytochrome d ubiquinol oxidase subunit I